MTAQELRKLLAQCPDDAEVIASVRDGEPVSKVKLLGTDEVPGSRKVLLS